MRPRWVVTKALVSGGLRLHWNYVGGVLLSTAGILLVNRYCGLGPTGEYQIAQQGIAILAVVPQAASMVFLQHLAAVGPAEAWIQQRRVIGLVLGTAVAVGIAAMGLAPTIVPLVLGPKFAGAAHLFQISALALPGMALAGVMAPQWLGRGLFVHMAALTCGLGILSVGLNVWWVPRFGAAGAAWTLVVTYSIAAACQALMIAYCEIERRESLRTVES
jgi:O-antigen/teichoic acid export membrane protein